MSNGKPRGKSGSEPGSPPPAEVLVWVFLAVAAAATIYFLLREPEDGPAVLDRAMAQARVLALAAALFGAVPGTWHILTRRGDRNLFAMAVLFNIILASYWTLRFALVP